MNEFTPRLTNWQHVIRYVNEQPIGKRFSRHQITVDLGRKVNLSLLPNYMYKLTRGDYVELISHGIYKRKKDIPLTLLLKD